MDDESGESPEKDDVTGVSQKLETGMRLTVRSRELVPPTG